MSSVRDDWNPPVLSECLNKKTCVERSSCEGILFHARLVIETSQSREAFLKGLLVLFLINPTLKSKAEPVIHISVTQAGPCSGPQPSNNIHCFLPLKKEHPLRSILDVEGGQIFGLKTRGSRLIATVRQVFFPRVPKKKKMSDKKYLTSLSLHQTNRWVVLHGGFKLVVTLINVCNSQLWSVVGALWTSGKWNCVNASIHSFLLR